MAQAVREKTDLETKYDPNNSTICGIKVRLSELLQPETEGDIVFFCLFCFWQNRLCMKTILNVSSQ